MYLSGVNKFTSEGIFIHVFIGLILFFFIKPSLASNDPAVLEFLTSRSKKLTENISGHQPKMYLQYNQWFLENGNKISESLCSGTSAAEHFFASNFYTELGRRVTAQVAEVNSPKLNIPGSKLYSIVLKTGSTDIFLGAVWIEQKTISTPCLLTTLVGLGILQSWVEQSNLVARQNVGYHISLNRFASSSQVYVEKFNFATYEKRTEGLFQTQVYNINFSDNFLISRKHSMPPAMVPLTERYSLEHYKKLQSLIQVKVGVIDTGIDYNHPALAYKLEYENFSNMLKRQKQDDDLKKAIEELKNKIKELDSQRFAKMVSYIQGLFNSGVNLKETYQAVIHEYNHLLELNARGTKRDSKLVGNLAHDNLALYDSLDANAETLEIKGGHGTFVSGIAARGPHIGIAPIHLSSNVAQEIDLASTRGVRIFNLSFGGQSLNLTTVRIYQAMKKHSNSVFIVASGNESFNHDKPDLHSEAKVYPTVFSLENQINVASVNDDGRLSSFSNYGKTLVHLAAKGANVKSEFPESQELVQSGTSAAAPQVTRTIARMLIIKPDLTVQQIKDILKNTVTKTPELQKKTIWGGYLNEAAALALTQKMYAPSP